MSLQEPLQLYNDHNENNGNDNEANYVVDIPDANYDNDGGNSNIILNVDPSVQPSPTGSQMGNM